MRGGWGEITEVLKPEMEVGCQQLSRSFSARFQMECADIGLERLGREYSTDPAVADVGEPTRNLIQKFS